MSKTLEQYVARSVKISELIVGSKYAANYRHAPTEAEICAQAEGMRANGCPDPIVVVEVEKGPDAGLHRVAGDLRTEGAKRLGWSEIPCKVYQGGKDPLRLAVQLRRLSDNVREMSFGDRVRSVRRYIGAGYNKAADIATDEKVGLPYVQMIVRLDDKLRPSFSGSPAVVKDGAIVTEAKPSWEDTVTASDAAKIAGQKGIVQAYRDFMAGRPIGGGKKDDKKASGRAAAAEKARRPLEEVAPWFKKFPRQDDTTGFRLSITPENESFWATWIGEFAAANGLPLLGADGKATKKVTIKDLDIIKTKLNGTI